MADTKLSTTQMIIYGLLAIGGGFGLYKLWNKSKQSGGGPQGGFGGGSGGGGSTPTNVADKTIIVTPAPAPVSTPPITYLPGGRPSTSDVPTTRPAAYTPPAVTTPPPVVTPPPATQTSETRATGWEGHPLFILKKDPDDIQEMAQSVY